MGDLVYIENELEHKGFADTLGALQGRIVKGAVTKDTVNAFYIGLEVLAKFPGTKRKGEIFLKGDCSGSGSGNSERSKNRIIVKVDANGMLIEDVAFVWRHDHRVEKLGVGFFKRAKFYRSIV